ncbi:hypothetical protein Tco_0167816 [Tanacetum coccineum]
MTSKSNNSELTIVLNSGIASSSTSVMKKGFLKTSPLPTHLNKMILGFLFSKQYWTKVVATTCYTQNRSTIVKRHLKTPYEIFFMDVPPSPNHERDFLADDPSSSVESDAEFEEDPQEEPEEEFEEDLEEDPKE